MGERDREKVKERKRKRERTIKRVGGRGNRSLLVEGYGTHQMVRRFMVFASSHLLLGVAARNGFMNGNRSHHHKFETSNRLFISIIYY